MRAIIAAVVLLTACGSSSRAGGGGDDDDDGSGCVIGDSQCPQCDPSFSTNTCNGNDVVTCNADGTYGSTVMTCSGGQSCSDGMCSNACTADGVDLIYAVDEASELLSFDPRLLPGDPFVKVGTLNCPTQGGSIQQNQPNVIPLSMSVDRTGVAWVVYTNGQIFNVDITNASCTATSYTPRSAGMNLFSMGFVTDTQGANTEKLFMAGGSTTSSPNGKLAMMDTTVTPLMPTVVAQQIAASSTVSNELTGTQLAQLYGFFPVLGGNSYVQEIDRTNGGAIGSKFPPNGFNITNGAGQIRDWAFAQWGGQFYVFATTSDASGDTNIKSTVYQVDKTSNNVTPVVMNSKFRVDGAGVSTCAPVVIE